MKKIRKSRPFSLKPFIVNTLRRASYRHPGRNEAKSRARVGYGLYQCASCKKTYGPKEISLDHIKCVVDPKVGFVDWNTYIERLFVDADGYQVLCNSCHDIKTAVEKELRKSSKK